MTSTTTTAARTPRAARPRGERRIVDSLARITEGFVPTPPAIAELLILAARDLGYLHAGALVLEPSAGKGALVREILSRNSDVHVHAVEPSDRHWPDLDALAAEYPGRVTVWRMTFEAFEAQWDGGEFDAVVMNPPFNTYTESNVWMDHVLLAHAMLTPGAQLAAIVPSSYPTKGDKISAGFRAWAQGNAGRFEKLPHEAFKDSGTTFGTGILTINKPVPARADGRPLWLLETLPLGEPVPFMDARITRPTVYPVQLVRSVGYQQDRVVRFAGVCFGCGRTQWVHDGTRDEVVPWAACNSVKPESVDKTGPEVLVCIECHDGETNDAALAAAAPYWADAPGEPEGPNTYALDLGRGLLATVTGRDAATGETVTVLGRLTADPHLMNLGGQDLVHVKMHPVTGGEVVLYVAQDTRVQCHIAAGEDTPGTVSNHAPAVPVVPAPRAASPAETTTDDPWEQLSLLVLPAA